MLELGGGYSSVVEHMLSTYQVLGAIPNTSIKNKSVNK